MIWFWILAGLLLWGCAAPIPPADDANPPPSLKPVELVAGEKLRVVATTTIIGDVVANVGGEAISLHVLIPGGADPHGFEPTPQDLITLNQAHVIFINGLGLEENLEKFLQELEGVAVVSVNEGVQTRVLEEDGRTEVDPHTWFQIAAVKQWVRNIQVALSGLDPAHQELYAQNAQAYLAQLDALDAELKALVAQIPPERRKLVTDHDSLGYLAEAYGFQVVGAVVPGLSTLASPAAADLAKLEDQIRKEKVPAIFVGSTANPNLAERIAADTGARVVALYTGSLSGPDGPAATYIEFMRYNVSAIVDALTVEEG